MKLLVGVVKEYYCLPEAYRQFGTRQNITQDIIFYYICKSFLKQMKNKTIFSWLLVNMRQLNFKF